MNKIWSVLVVLCFCGGGGAPMGELSFREQLPLKMTFPLAPIGDCNNLAGIGVWENATPPLPGFPGPTACDFGTRHFALDPTNPSTIFLGTCKMGIWRSTDCGSTWTHVDTGTGGSVLDQARQITYAIDPTNPLVQYTSSGYGPGVHGGNGLWKTGDGGVNWTLSFPDAANNGAVTSNFSWDVNLDPADSTHLLLTMHAPCLAPHKPACWGESHDSGTTWTLRDGDASWTGHDGQYIWVLGDVQHLLYASDLVGVWQSSNGGTSWAAISGLSADEAHEGGQTIQDGAGAWYFAGNKGVARSTDRATWTLIANSGNSLQGLAFDGTVLYSSKGAPTHWGSAYQPFRSSTNGTTWAAFASPALINGGPMAYDATRGVLYSSNFDAGFWRVKVR